MTECSTQFVRVTGWKHLLAGGQTVNEDVRGVIGGVIDQFEFDLQRVKENRASVGLIVDWIVSLW